MDMYQENILDHYRRPRNFGRLDPAAVHEESNPLCGDKLTLYLRTDGDAVRLQFEGTGCAISMAAASILTELVAGRPVAEAESLSDQELLDELGIELSPTRMKCALLGLSGLRHALQTASARLSSSVNEE